jgi:hypothetical protein
MVDAPSCKLGSFMLYGGSIPSLLKSNKTRPKGRVGFYFMGGLIPSLLKINKKKNIMTKNKLSIVGF